MSYQHKIQNPEALIPSSPTIRSHRTDGLAKILGAVAAIGDYSTNLINISETGCAVFDNEKRLSLGSYVSLSITAFNDVKIYDGRAKVKRVFESDGVSCVGISFESNLVQHHLIGELERAHDLQTRLESERKTLKQLPKGFLELVAEYKTFLGLLKTEIDLVENQLKIDSPSRNFAFDTAAKVILGPYVADRLRSLNLCLNGFLPALADKSIKKLAINYFRREVSEYLHEASFINRGWQKPRGYAGDYEMMNQIYRNNLEGHSLFGKILHYYGINEFSSQSVRYRKDHFMNEFASQITHKQFVNIVGLASGPGREVVEFVKSATGDDLRKIRFTLIDQDLEALLDSRRVITQTVLESNKEANINYLNISVKDLLDHSSKATSFFAENYDLIYTAGLYDYLTQPVARALTKILFASLKRGGKIIIGNFHPNNPTKAISEFICDWYLIHRNLEEMADLASQLPAHKLSHQMDPGGIECILEIVKE